jgi:hypothetical protein
MKRVDREIPDPYGPGDGDQLVAWHRGRRRIRNRRRNREPDLGGFGSFLDGLLGVEDPPAGQR